MLVPMPYNPLRSRKKTYTMSILIRSPVLSQHFDRHTQTSRNDNSLVYDIRDPRRTVMIHNIRPRQECIRARAASADIACLHTQTPSCKTSTQHSQHNEGVPDT
jgi:hypothetical protein